ncbi:MAG: hypothetical protein L3K19_07900 [Thermoplasmata archaeon]|nr:hypothetical protein [Thermoplasmata archaeon]
MLARQRHHGAHQGNHPVNEPSNGSKASVPPPNGSGTPPPPADDSFPHDPLTASMVHLGLTPHEAQMYHTLLRHGPSTARYAILHSRLDRATGYRILSRLRARGLVTATGYRPQRFVALEAARLLDRISSLLRDELDLQRIVREIYVAGLPPPARDTSMPIGLTSPPPPTPEPTNGPGLSLASRYRLYPGHETIGRYLISCIGNAKEEVSGLSRPGTIPESIRTDLAQALLDALKRGVRVRLVLDYHPIDLEFLTTILRALPEPTPTLEIRFFAPQLARLFLIDRRLALRSLGTPACPFHGPDLGIASEDLEFVRVQTARFQTTWREGVPMETALRSPQGSVLAPPSSSQELRHWVERTARSEPRGYPMDALGFQPHRTFRS